MAKSPIWTRTLSEVLGYTTQTVQKKSERTGNLYTTEVIPRLEVVAVGEPEEVEKEGVKHYRYSVYDMSKGLEYKVTCPNFVKIGGVKQVVLTGLTGGALSSGRGWYKADSVQVAKRK
mgnify:CR=1 FL=1